MGPKPRPFDMPYIEDCDLGGGVAVGVEAIEVMPSKELNCDCDWEWCRPFIEVDVVVRLKLGGPCWRAVVWMDEAIASAYAGVMA